MSYDLIAKIICDVPDCGSFIETTVNTDDIMETVGGVECAMEDKASASGWMYGIDYGWVCPDCAKKHKKTE